MKTVLRIILAACLWPATALAQSAPVVVEYYHVDALGSVRAVTNASGAEVRRHEYAPFGEELATVIGVDSVRFVGKERDAETGLDYSMARSYAAKWGRFTTVDPGHVGGNIFDPQSWNAYGYARNNPLRFVDPLGTAYYVEGEGGQPFWIHDDRDLWKYTQDGTRFTNGKIFNRSGLQIGTYQHFEDFPALLGEIAYGTGPLVPAVGVAAVIVEVGLSFAYPVAGTFAGCAGYGCSKKDVALAGAGLSPKAARLLGGLASLAGKSLREVIRLRGGGASQVRRVENLADLTLREVAEKAAGGDQAARDALKIAKDAKRLSEKRY